MGFHTLDFLSSAYGVLSVVIAWRVLSTVVDKKSDFSGSERVTILLGAGSSVRLCLSLPNS